MDYYSPQDIMRMLGRQPMSPLQGRWLIIFESLDHDPARKANSITQKVELKPGVSTLSADFLLRGIDKPIPAPFVINPSGLLHNPTAGNYRYRLEMGIENYATFFSVLDTTRFLEEVSIMNSGVTVRKVVDDTKVYKNIEKVSSLLSSGRLKVNEFRDFRSPDGLESEEDDYEASARFVTLDERPLYCHCYWRIRRLSSSREYIGNSSAQIWEKFTRLREKGDFDALVAEMEK